MTREDDMERRLDTVEKTLISLGINVENHVKSCDARGRRGERLQIVILAGVLSICAALAPVVFSYLMGRHH